MRKRLFDVVLATLMLLLLLPFMGIIALAIIASAGGPVLFHQLRVGKAGHCFRIHKFRTMINAMGESGPQITVKGDRRVFPIGKFLRKWKLDELPQLYNVLVGEMSFVGPRPETPAYVAYYSDEQRRVLDLRPGITDVATLRFRDEEDILAHSNDPLRYYVEHCIPEKIALNLEYSSRASFGSDIVVLLRTAIAVFRPNSQSGKTD